MANAKICDRCHAIMAEVTFEEQKARKYVLGIHNNSPLRNSETEIMDICPNCYGKLLKFMLEAED